MSTFVNFNALAPNPSASPLTNVITAAGDQFAAEMGRKYILRFVNGSATPGNIVMNDPTSQSPVGATAFTPAVTTPIAAGAVKTITVDAARFRDSSGNISWTYSANITNAASLCEIYGPI